MKKRSRLDGGISREEYSAAEMRTDLELSHPQGENGQYPGKNDRYALSIGAKKSAHSPNMSRSQLYSRNVLALNDSFCHTLHDQLHKNPTACWEDNMREYLYFLREIKLKFASQHGKVVYLIFIERRYAYFCNFQIMTFGSGDCGQLAHGVEEDEDMIVKYPRVVQRLAKIPISFISCGGLHSAAISIDGSVYTWGCNDDGALGRDGEENFPAKVRGFGPSEEYQAIQVVAGDCHTLALTSAGKVLTWGCYKDKEGKIWCDAPNAVKAFKNKQIEPLLIHGLENISDVRCGSCFNLARTSDGSVFSWGLGEQGQLGRKADLNMKNDQDEYDTKLVFDQHLTPARVTLGTESLSDVKAMGCGAYHSLFVIGGNGYLYACGLNNYGQLGIGSTTNSSDLQLVKDLVACNVVQVEGGTHHSAVLTVSGEVYTFGRGDSGQLGMLDECTSGNYKDR